jgi:signal transduction histidine kinase
MTAGDVSGQDDRGRHRQHVEQLAALGCFAVGLAHELNSPISVILSRIELMIMEGEEHRFPELLADLRVLHGHSQRLARIAQALLSFGREHQRDRHPIDLSAASLEQVLVNLLLSARDAMSSGGTIRIETAVVPAPSQPQAIRPESLFRTADGTALGLAVASAIVRDHGGTVDVRAEPGRGTTFTFVCSIAEGAVK